VRDRRGWLVIYRFPAKNPFLYYYKQPNQPQRFFEYFAVTSDENYFVTQLCTCSNIYTLNITYPTLGGGILALDTRFFIRITVYFNWRYVYLLLKSDSMVLRQPHLVSCLSFEVVNKPGGRAIKLSIILFWLLASWLIFYNIIHLLLFASKQNNNIM
jgi:hypothetical protein